MLVVVTEVNIPIQISGVNYYRCYTPVGISNKLFSSGDMGLHSFRIPVYRREGHLQWNRFRSTLQILVLLALFSSLVLLGLNKYIYLLILGQLALPRLSNNLINEVTSTFLFLLFLITLATGISLNIKALNLRKFITTTSMINLAILLIFTLN